MELTFLGGANEVGRSAVLVDDRLLLDYGMQASTPPRYPIGDVDPEAVVVSHGHLDHAGAVPALLTGDSQPPIHWTAPTRDLTKILAKDTLTLHGGTPQCPFTETHVQRMAQVSETHSYEETFEAAGYEITLFNAGHIPGSAHILVEDGVSHRSVDGPADHRESSLLYTGDFHTGDQRLVTSSSTRPDADVVVTESTYASVEREDRHTVEERFVKTLEQTVWEGGTAVVPAFAIGRTQEILMVCEQFGVDCYVDGMGIEVNDVFQRYPDYIRDHDALSLAISNARTVTGGKGQRERIAKSGNVVVTTSGMLGGGPAMTYIPAIHDHPVNTIALTGYQVEGTTGRELLDTGSAEFDGQVLPVSATVDQFDFSAHAGRRGLRSFLDAYRDSKVLVVHGDETERFADDLRAQGFDANAPGIGDDNQVL